MRVWRFSILSNLIQITSTPESQQSVFWQNKYYLLIFDEKIIMVKVLRKNKSQTLNQQLAEILSTSATPAPKRKWTKFFGKVHFGSHPVDYQRKMRDEE